MFIHPLSEGHFMFYISAFIWFDILTYGHSTTGLDQVVGRIQGFDGHLLLQHCVVDMCMMARRRRFATGILAAVLAWCPYALSRVRSKFNGSLLPCRI